MLSKLQHACRAKVGIPCRIQMTMKGPSDTSARKLLGGAVRPRPFILQINGERNSNT